MAVCSTAIAALVYSSLGVANPQYIHDTNVNTYASSASGSIVYCPTGFSFLGTRCLHAASGTEFQAYEVVGYPVDHSCGGTISLRHQAGPTSGANPSTHVYAMNAAGGWHYVSTVASSTSIQTHLLNYNIGIVGVGEQRVLFGRATAPASTRQLRWYEAVVTANPTSCF